MELHAGRYGPYVKHGSVNATLPDKEGMDALTLADAVALLDAKSGKTGGRSTGKRADAPAARPPKPTNGKSAAKPAASTKEVAASKSSKGRSSKPATRVKVPKVTAKPKTPARKRTH